MLAALQAQPDPVGIGALATALGRHPNTVREQVNWLVARGFVWRRPQPRTGRGRPSWLYQAHGPRPGEGHFVELAAALAWRLQDSIDGPNQALAEGQRWAEEILTKRSAKVGASARSGRLHVVEVLDDLGYEPTADTDVTTVTLHRCPLLQAAHEFPEVVCTAHLGLVRTILTHTGADPEPVELTPFSAPGQCRLRLLASAEQSDSA